MSNNDNTIVRTVDHTYHEQEAKVRWQNTKAYKQSQERTTNWKKEDYDRVTQEGKQLAQRMAKAMDKGFDSPEFQELVKQHHVSIEVFYDCPLESYSMLADSYISDPRFKAHYDNVKPGLAEFLHKGIKFYCQT